MRFSDAQTACPITVASTGWTDESATSLGIAGFSGLKTITGDFTVDTVLFTFSSAQIGFKAEGPSIAPQSGL
ncbi:MAG: hypothetical protein GC205_01215 [Bacteroidetes bacterium]|nr:hypothetical protein [Bacteroidota bacterium]